ncbi:uncharacterized protein TRIVIDRAFT_61048 [Trichoderma virens Gv29-8]|uniref:Uncharacterized protein n=1 Tax=Hypocrea virens (strain Gv29-8 / FGSC 10586) TaxID=413071 RepID=G9MLL8_HYPVG|nr:uncharacterized protein TRIVIDRAFT_61048 [Trichoderma virens Gv29-8]EHK24245.1 hypothetical protein TRIVIDRAFT_61048 [Trichoderma virens Gv29-8]
MMDFLTPHVMRPTFKASEIMYDNGKDAAFEYVEFQTGSFVMKGLLMRRSIFAIHGLGSNPETAWAYQRNDSRVYWLRDFLPKARGLSDIRVIMVNHQTRWDSNTAYLGFHDHASELLEEIQNLHRANPERPIIFIAHSFGGILLKKARSSSELLELLMIDGPALLDLESEFYDAYVDRYRFRGFQPFICDFYEMRPERIGKLVLGSMVGKSNRQPRHGLVKYLDTDHRGLNKFQSHDDPNFQTFVTVLRWVLDYALLANNSPGDLCPHPSIPVTNSVPVTDSVPVTNNVPVVDAVSITDSVSIIEAVPVVDDLPGDDVVPVTDSAPVNKTIPIAGTVLVSPALPVPNAVPIAGVLLLVADAVPPGAVPIAGIMPVTNAVPATEAASISGTVPVTKTMPVADTVFIAPAVPVPSVVPVAGSVVVTEVIPAAAIPAAAIPVAGVMLIADAVPPTEAVSTSSSVLIPNAIPVASFMPATKTEPVAATVPVAAAMPVAGAVPIAVNLSVFVAIPATAAKSIAKAVPVLQPVGLLERLATTLLYIVWMAPNVVFVGALAGLRELYVSWLDEYYESHRSSSATLRLVMIAAYDTLINLPLGHFLIWVIEKTPSGHTSLWVKILQIIVSNIVINLCQITPIQNFVYLAGMAYIAGARNYDQFYGIIQSRFFKLTWINWFTLSGYKSDDVKFYIS